MTQMPDKWKIVRNEKYALQTFKKLRWKGQIACIHCGCVERITTYSVATNGVKRYFCPHCTKTFTDLSGTLFSKTKIPLWKWIYVLITLLESTGSLSSAETARMIQVSYPTAWRMMRKLRKACHDEPFLRKLRGVVESDEAWFSHKGNQTVLLGMVERDGALKMFPIQDRTVDSLCGPHKLHVEKGSMVCTDSHTGYNGLNYGDYIHHFVNHSIGEFAWNHIHSNTIEGVWSMLKGIIRTIHHGVSKKHFLGYCHLFTFMYSNRKKSIHEKFTLLFGKFCQPRYCLY